jgi:predicted extracellular nuclease
MSHTKRLRSALGAIASVCALLSAASVYAAPVYITEWQYNGSEFVELTNTSSAAVDFTNYSFDDDSRAPGSMSLASLGFVQAGETVLIVEGTAAAFRTLWNLPGTVRIVGGNTNNLGRNDEVNIYDGLLLVDRLTYGDDVNRPGTIRTDLKSGNPVNQAAIGANNAAGWVFSALGDSYGSHTSTTGGFIGNPGTFVNPVPLPAALPLLLSGLFGFGAVRRFGARRG